MTKQLANGLGVNGTPLLTEARVGQPIETRNGQNRTLRTASYQIRPFVLENLERLRILGIIQAILGDITAEHAATNGNSCF